ncbi:hypothetical protein ACFOY4_41445 [Actinomadura syzygii]|uniref:Uncharacterized protein n=1 Tax=Actinomadura syzygii TaxID=1427538 RepID=A0A5D0TQG9_9ACTN|nr:hypothetical protein [Actinomadura syzygii]TYC07586.1 hypothetical protein FXF65_42040 [Actinomadura syzygii]
MSLDRRRGDPSTDRELDLETAEDLLTGIWRDPRSVTHPVAGLLAAATTPPSDQELDGEEAAVAAFRHTQLNARRRRHRGRTAHRVLLPIATAKMLTALAVAGTAAGGAALAANNGQLPVLERPPHSSAPSSATATEKATTPVPTSGQPRRSPPSTSLAPGSPNYSTPARLCRTYLAEASRKKRSAAPPKVSASELAQLIAAAGDRDKITTYCARVLAGKEQKPTKPPKKTPKEPEREKKKQQPGKPPHDRKPEKPKEPKRDSRP